MIERCGSIAASPLTGGANSSRCIHILAENPPLCRDSFVCFDEETYQLPLDLRRWSLTFTWNDVRPTGGEALRSVFGSASEQCTSTSLLPDLGQTRLCPTRTKPVAPPTNPVPISCAGARK